jgi:hypothetical protein
VTTIALAQTKSRSITTPDSALKDAEVTTLVVFDDRVSDIETLNRALLPGSIGLTINSQTDALAVITQLLTATGAKYLAIVAHGAPGVVHLGKHSIDLAQLQAQSELLRSWDVKEIALYSCEVAQGEIGKSLIYQLSELTGATVAAAATQTGNRLLGGSWDLTITTGAIAAPILFDSSILERYPAVLALSFGSASYSVGSPNSLIVGDFNGDGKLDLATTNNFSKSVLVQLGNETGGFGAETNFEIGFVPLSITVGDFNGDGKLDLATANFDNTVKFGGNSNLTIANNYNVSVFLGNGTGDFETATNFFAVGNRPLSLTVGDFNGDGKLDLATANNLSDNVSVLLGNGTGDFGAATNFEVGSYPAYPSSVTVGDFNGDGKLDLATANGGSDNLSVLLGNGTGGFGAATNFAVGSSPRSVTAGDFNGDGKLDLATANYLSDNVSVLLGDGTGGFGAATDFAVGGFPNSVTAGDLNGDGKLDLATANVVDKNVSVLLGNGIGSFGVATNFGVGTTGPDSVVTVGDFNGDGKLDLATTNPNKSYVSVLLNTTAPTRNDFNGDGKSDILWRNTDGSIAEWQMDGSTVTSKSVGSLTSDWIIAGTADFNGDLRADLLLRHTDGSIAQWQMNGSTATSKSVGSLTSDWTIAGTADFNGDGKADILLQNTNGNIATWQMDSSTVTKASTLAKITPDWTIAATADFNGDGKADILMQNTDGSMAIWQMDGAAVINASSVGKLTNGWNIAGTGDFNGDGKSDLLFRNTNGSVAEWQMNGLTVAATATVGTAPSDWKITGTGDFNGDGKADILWRNDLGGVATWQMNGATVLAAGST